MSGCLWRGCQESRSHMDGWQRAYLEEELVEGPLADAGRARDDDGTGIANCRRVVSLDVFFHSFFFLGHKGTQILTRSHGVVKARAKDVDKRSEWSPHRRWLFRKLSGRDMEVDGRGVWLVWGGPTVPNWSRVHWERQTHTSNPAPFLFSPFWCKMASASTLFLTHCSPSHISHSHFML